MKFIKDLFVIGRLISVPSHTDSSLGKWHELDRAWTDLSNRCYDLEAELQG